MVLNDFSVGLGVIGAHVQAGLSRHRLPARQWLWLPAGMPPSILSAVNGKKKTTRSDIFCHMYTYIPYTI